jgi:hypothetical protein
LSEEYSAGLPNAEQALSEKIASMKAEKVRLEEKFAAADDNDIKTALENRLVELNQSIRKVQESAASDDPLSIKKIPLESIKEIKAEDLPYHLRTAAGLLANGKQSDFRGLMASLLRAAPESGEVNLLYSKALVKANHPKEAVEVLKKVLQSDPKNITVEKALAEAVLMSDRVTSIEDALRIGNNELNVSESEINARIGTAAFVNLLFPGSGLIILAKVRLGIIWVVGWLCCVVTFIVGASLIGGQNDGVANPSNWSVPMWFGAIGALAILAGTAIYIQNVSKTIGQRVAKRKIEHPQPPVNLPFE